MCQNKLDYSELKLLENKNLIKKPQQRLDRQLAGAYPATSGRGHVARTRYLDDECVPKRTRIRFRNNLGFSFLLSLAHTL